MGTLAETLVGTLFGTAPPETFEVGLVSGGREVAVRGYRRATVDRDGWTVNGATAEATVSFGPYTESFDFDTVLLAAGDLLEPQPLPTPIRLWAGVGLTHILTLRVS